MKKLLFMLIILFLVSCSNRIEDAKIDNPEKATTVEIQQNVIDSCATIATDGEHLYIMKNNIAVEKYYVVTNGQAIVDGSFIFIIISFIVVLVLTLIAIIRS